MNVSMFNAELTIPDRAVLPRLLLSFRLSQRLVYLPQLPILPHTSHMQPIFGSESESLGSAIV